MIFMSLCSIFIEVCMRADNYFNIKRTDEVVAKKIKNSSAIAERPRCRMGRQFWLNVEDILPTYRSIFNHCDVIGLESYRIQ